jgi:hypothetical protein
LKRMMGDQTRLRHFSSTTPPRKDPGGTGIGNCAGRLGAVDLASTGMVRTPNPSRIGSSSVAAKSHLSCLSRLGLPP